MDVLSDVLKVVTLKGAGILQRRILGTVECSLAGPGVFALLLFLTLLPGEPVDIAALLFGTVVFCDLLRN